MIHDERDCDINQKNGWHKSSIVSYEFLFCGNRKLSQWWWQGLSCLPNVWLQAQLIIMQIYFIYLYIYIVYWCQPFFSFVLHSGNYKIVISMTRGDARVTFKWSKRIKLKHFPILFKWIFPHIIVCNLKFKIFQLFSFLYSIEFF